MHKADVMRSAVFNEDCIAGMKRYADKFFDLAIVDPPYKDETIGLTAGFNRGHFKLGIVTVKQIGRAHV